MKNRAFTLAEVLITLTIIGVIAAITIPTLMREYEIQQYETAVKSAYTTLSTGFNIFLKEYGDFSVFKGGNDADFAENLDKIVRKYFRVSETCFADKCPDRYNYNLKMLKGYKSSGVVKNYLSGSDLNNKNFFYTKLNNLTFVIGNNSDTNKISIRLDTNGIRGPNTLGKDVFSLNLNEQGVLYPDCSVNYCIAQNTPNTKNCPEYWKNNPLQCGKTGTKLRDDNTTNIIGQNCIARIMENGWKMDYLH